VNILEKIKQIWRGVYEEYKAEKKMEMRIKGSSE